MGMGDIEGGKVMDGARDGMGTGGDGKRISREGLRWEGSG